MNHFSRSAIFTGLILCGFYSLAAHADCENINRQSYISAESTDQPEGTPGKRTWFLEKLAEDHIKNSDDSCVAKLYETATQESNTYWQSIKTKYSCNDTAASDTCPDNIWSNVKSNLDYISNVDNLAKEKIAHCAGCSRGNPGSPLNDSNLNNISDINAAAHAAAAAKASGPDCSKVAPNDRRGLEESAVDAAIEGSARCVAGFVEGIWKGLVNDGLGSLMALGKSLLHPIETFSSLKTLALKLATDTGPTLQAIGYNIADHFGLGEDFICSNNKRRAEVICQMVTRIPTDVAILIATKNATGWAAGKAVDATASAAAAAGRAAGVAADAVKDAALGAASATANAARKAGAAVKDSVKAAGARVGAAGAKAAQRARAAADGAKAMAKQSMDHLKAKVQATAEAVRAGRDSLGRAPLVALTKLQERMTANLLKSTAKKFQKADSVEKLHEVTNVEVGRLRKDLAKLDPDSSQAKLIKLQIESIAEQAETRYNEIIKASNPTP